MDLGKDAVTWDQAFDIAESAFDLERQAYDLDILINDPERVALSVRLLQCGRRNSDSIRVEVPATTARRSNRN